MKRTAGDWVVWGIESSMILMSVIKLTIVNMAPPVGFSIDHEMKSILEPTTIRHAPRNVMRYNCLALNQWVRDNRLSLYQLSHGGLFTVSAVKAILTLLFVLPNHVS